MIVVIVFILQTFLFGFTSAQQCKIPCQPCKVIAAPMPEEFRGNWHLIDPSSKRCPQETPCLYRNEDMTSRICACDPGNITYTESCDSFVAAVHSCNRDCTATPHVNMVCDFQLTLSKQFTNLPKRRADGKLRSVLVYNGQLPGPTLTVCEGDDVTVELINDLDEDTTLHFHGIRQKQKDPSTGDWSRGGPWSDGVPFVTQCPIPASSSFKYTFLGSSGSYNNAPAGTYWYHSHTGRQRLNGAAGKLIIMPRQKRSDINIDVDDPDNSLFLQEWYNTTQNHIPTGLLVNGIGKQSSFYYQCSPTPGCITNYKEGNSVLFTTVPNLHYGTTSQPDYEVFNVDKGKSYRFRIIGGIGDDHPIRVSIEDHTFTAIATDSIDISPVDSLDALWITAGERYDIVIKTKTTPRSDAYKINIFSNRHVTLCTRAWLKYSHQIVSDVPEAHCATMATEVFTKVLNPVPDKYSEWTHPTKYIYPDKLKALVLPAGINLPLIPEYINMPGLTFNGFSMKYPDIPFLFQFPSITTHRCPGTPVCEHVIQPLWRSTGDPWFEIILFNGPNTAHPIHHHGGWFNIVAMGQLPAANPISEAKIRAMSITRNLINPVFKDTIQVPTNGYVIFRAPMDNRGAWIVHCHINYHLEHGMAMVFQIGSPPPPFSRGPNPLIALRNLNRRC